MAVSLESRIAVIHTLLAVMDGRKKLTHEQAELARQHARDAIAAIEWLRDDPDAKAMMRAKAERMRAGA